MTSVVSPLCESIVRSLHTYLYTYHRIPLHNDGVRIEPLEMAISPHHSIETEDHQTDEQLDIDDDNSDDAVEMEKS